MLLDKILSHGRGALDGGVRSLPVMENGKQAQAKCTAFYRDRFFADWQIRSIIQIREAKPQQVKFGDAGRAVGRDDALNQLAGMLYLSQCLLLECPV